MPAPGAGDAETLQFSDASGCRAWIARLPLGEPAKCNAVLASQIRLLPAASMAGAAKLEVLELLRDPVARVQAEMAKACRGKPLPLDVQDRAAWEQVQQTWQAMAKGYDALIDAMATTAPDLAEHAHLICQRALRYTALALIEYCHLYHMPIGALWQQLHRLYVFAENAGFTWTTVNDSCGRQVEGTSCAAIYVHALLFYLAQPDSLTGEQLVVLDRWLERWEALVRLAPDPLSQSDIPALAVDLASDKGAGLARNMPAAGVRHLDLEPLRKTLRQTAAALKQKTPGELGLGDLSRDDCESLLKTIFLQWCAAGTGRIDERTPTSIKVMISPHIASMHFQLTGKAFRQPVGDISAAERQRLEMLGAASNAGAQAIAAHRSTALDTWAIVNQSLSGFLGSVRADEVVNRVSHHQLVALQPQAKKVLYLGIVQRLALDGKGTMWVGLRIILGAPKAIAVRIAERGGEYARGLLMPEDAQRKIPASVVLEPGLYGADRVLDVHIEKEKPYRVRLQALLDRGSNFERATYSLS